MMLFSMLLVSIFFLSVVSATPNNIKEANAKYTVGSTEIILNNHPDSNSATLMITSNNSTNLYTVNVDKLDNTYRAKIYDVDGKLIKTESYSSNPLLSSNGRAPAIIDSIIVEASVDIYPDKYSYTKGSEGTVNLVVDNYALPDGFTNYYLRIPLPAKYINVYDGLSPDYVYNLPTSSSYVFIPEKGRVYGPATVLFWQDVHTFGYTETMKVKVKYDNKGSFNFYAYDHEQEVASGLPAWDDDSFTVTVS